MCWTQRGLLVLSLALAPAAVEAAPRVTHKQVQAIKVKGKAGATLQSMARTSDGRLVALVGPSRYEGIRGAAKSSSTSEIRVFDKDGTELAKWSVDFTGQAVGAGPAGSVFVGGDGKIAKYDAEGKLLIPGELAHLKAIIADKDELR